MVILTVMATMILRLGETIVFRLLLRVLAQIGRRLPIHFALAFLACGSDLLLAM